LPKSRKWINLAIAVMFAAFGYGLVKLYVLQFAKGDVYPAYSSYRADPVGTRALYESLGVLRGLTVERHAKPFSQESVANTIGNRRSTWMVLGLNAEDPDHMPLDVARGMETIAQQGGRVIVAFEPTWDDLREEYEIREARMERIRRMQERRSGIDEESEEPDGPDSTDSTDSTEETEETEETDQTDQTDQTEETDTTEESDDTDEELPDPDEMYGPRVELKERWGVRLAFDLVQVDNNDRIKAADATLVQDSELPGAVTWRNVIWFDELSEEWEIIYARDDKPVLIERPFGAGSLVFSSDSYFLSNEALQRERHPELLAWLIGPNGHIVFEESHLGIARAPGVMTLIRGYGLYGVFWALIGLAVLYVWKNGISFVPPYEDARPSDARQASGRDSAAGFANLIRRSITPRELLHACLAQYKHSLGGRLDVLGEPIQKMEAIANAEVQKPRNERDPAGAYRAMCRILDKHIRG
jgi:hypothetical protein